MSRHAPRSHTTRRTRTADVEGESQRLAACAAEPGIDEVHDDVLAPADGDRDPEHDRSEKQRARQLLGPVERNLKVARRHLQQRSDHHDAEGGDRDDLDRGVDKVEQAAPALRQARRAGRCDLDRGTGPARSLEAQ